MECLLGMFFRLVILLCACRMLLCVLRSRIYRDFVYGGLVDRKVLLLYWGRKDFWAGILGTLLCVLFRSFCIVFCLYIVGILICLVRFLFCLLLSLLLLLLLDVCIYPT